MFRKKLAILTLAVAALGIFPLGAQAASGTSKGGDVPVVTGLQSEPDYTPSASGTSKGGDVPVVTG